MKIHMRENWYRDLWLLAITIFVVLALVSANNAANEVKASRRSSIEKTCREENERNDQAKVALAELANKTGAPPGRLEPLKREAVLNLFVNAVIPKYDCAERVERLTKP